MQILDYNNSRVASISPSRINLRENGVSTFEANAKLKQYGIRDVGTFYVRGQSSDTENIIELRDRNDGREYVAINAPLYLEEPLSVTQGGTGAITAADARANLEITPENIKAFKQIPGYVTREILDDYNIKYWYGGRVTGPVALAIGLPEAEWFVLNMSKDDDVASSWPRQVFYQLGGPMIYQRTCSYQTWNPVTKVSIVDEYGCQANIWQEYIVGARSFVLNSCGSVYQSVGAIFKETGLQLWDYTNGGSELWWLPKEIGAAPPVSLYQHDADRDAVWAEISKIQAGQAAPIFITDNGCYILTGTKLNIYMSGIITRTTPTSVAIMAFAESTANAIYTWRITNLNTDNWMVGAITQYTGTVI
jgi:hypothetical protein